MLRNRLYYGVKPYVPWRVRMAFRGMLARRQRERHRDTWPIDEEAARPPEGWPGWPEGKQFAFAITHDVESPAGLAKCRQLMRLEMDLGFRSSFGFIPEGEYRVPSDLREELLKNGFGVIVHDLHHDGSLYSSRKAFFKQARQINTYLKEWNASGFRPGFMFHNLDWLHQLEISYDSSTFDTDPFEPQSDGVGTIFPFWVPAPGAEGAGAGHGAKGQEQSARGEELRAGDNGQGVDSADALPGPLAPSLPLPRRLVRHSPKGDGGSPPGEGGSPSFPLANRTGYVEIPYTLPQDSTLFLVLRETSPDIWLRKLDWVAARGGMALVNVHPDYLRFEGEPSSPKTFPVAHYLRLLEHVRQRYAASAWQVLPRDIASYVRGMTPRPVRRAPRRVCMVTHSYYESDNRVTRYAEALAGRGDRVDVFALRFAPHLPRRETMGGVDVYRIQERYGKTERAKVSYLWTWLRFLVKSSWHITRHHARQRYDVVHVHNLPDLLVFAAWYPKLTGSGLILDVHDIVPEFYASKFGGKRHVIASAILRWLERRSARFADRVIISNHLWLEKFATRTGTGGRCSVFINNVDRRVYQPGHRARDDGRLIILFPGGLEWHQGVDIALHAFKQVSTELPNAEFHIYGEGKMKPSLVALTSKLGFNGQVRFFDGVPAAEIARVMADADLGVVPKRADSFGNEAYSTKIMEFMSVGVPVVVSSTKIDRFYFNDTVVRFFESGNPEAMAAAIVEVLRDESLRRRLVTNALEYSSRNSWETRKADYLQLVDSLCDGGNRKPGAGHS